MTQAAYDGFRVAIVGGCQVAGLGEWIGRMLPGATVARWHVNSSANAAPDHVRAQIAGSDLVVTQFSDAMEGGRLGTSVLGEQFARVVFMPVFVFGGFHPDIVSTGLQGNPFAFVHGPLNILHSGIALASYHLGVPPERVPRLYNALVFDVLGHSRAFDLARDACIAILAGHGYDIADAFALWLRDGCFMYSDNHPHIRVLRTFAEMILAHAGLEAAPVEDAACVPDPLASSVQWPVYPALARRLGFAGSTAFTRALHSVPPGEAREMTLPAFVAASYQAFEAAGRANLDRVPRVLADMEALRPLITL